MNTPVMAGCEPFSSPGSPDGVLVLHGFTGNPQSLRPLAQAVAAAGYSVELPRLPGHGTSLEDMMTTTWADWSAAALASFDELASRCRGVSVVGLSMGGALAAFIAEQRSPAAAVFINPLVIPPAPELVEGIDQLLASGVTTFDSIGSDIKREGNKEFSYSATPLACAKSLFAGVSDLSARLDAITAPALLFSSREDHVVSSDNGDVLMTRVSGPIQRVWLEHSYHVATLDNDAPLIESATVAFLASSLAP